NPDDPLGNAEVLPPRPELGEGAGGGEGYARLLKGRRSVRKYRPDPVPDEDLAAILEGARWAPSPHNSEPWRFVVLRRAEAKERLAAAMARRWVDDLSGDGWSPEAIERELRISRRRITEAPVVVVA